ncbi:MAG: hypothetical protein ACFFCT_00735 [Candidatus Odinarchaeota archaeon]
MSSSENSSAQYLEFHFRNLKRFLPVVIIAGLWCLFESNLLIEIHDYVLMRIIFSALIIVLSSFVLNDGNENLGLSSLAFGFTLYFTSIIVFFGFPSSILHNDQVRLILVLFNTFGAAISLFGAVSLSLWLSTTRLNCDKKEVKYGASILSITVLMVWIGLVSFWILPEIYEFTLPGVELLFYIALIMSTSIFIPRRQFMSIFFFTVGFGVTLGGLLILTRASSLDAFYLGYFLRIFGTMLLIIFALPMSASPASHKEIPESGIYITAAVWFFLEILLTGNLFPFSVFRVFAIIAIVILALRNLRFNMPIIMAIGMIVGASLAILGFYVFTIGQLTLLRVTIEYGGLALTITSITLCMSCALSLGESIRLKLKDNRSLTLGIGLILILSGLACGISALFIPLFYFSLDVAFLALTGLGSMLIVIKPRKVLNYIFIIAALFTGAIVLTEFLVSFQILYYSGLTITIFSGVQQYRVESTKENNLVTN